VEAEIAPEKRPGLFQVPLLPVPQSAVDHQALANLTSVPIAGPGPAFRARLPCPLLVADRCLAYPVRPLTCRGLNSSSAAKCERALELGNAAAVPFYAPQQALCTLVLDGELHELSAALAIALTPDAAECWLTGEAIFTRSRML
jgi:hypothetical protein